jgi:hypothetical protein
VLRSLVVSSSSLLLHELSSSSLSHDARSSSSFARLADKRAARSHLARSEGTPNGTWVGHMTDRTWYSRAKRTWWRLAWWRMSMSGRCNKSRTDGWPMHARACVRVSAIHCCTKAALVGTSGLHCFVAQRETVTRYVFVSAAFAGSSIRGLRALNCMRLGVESHCCVNTCTAGTKGHARLRSRLQVPLAGAIACAPPNVEGVHGVMADASLTGCSLACHSWRLASEYTWRSSGGRASCAQQPAAWVSSRRAPCTPTTARPHTATGGGHDVGEFCAPKARRS